MTPASADVAVAFRNVRRDLDVDGVMAASGVISSGGLWAGTPWASYRNTNAALSLFSGVCPLAPTRSCARIPKSLAFFPEDPTVIRFQRLSLVAAVLIALPLAVDCARSPQDDAGS